MAITKAADVKALIEAGRRGRAAAFAEVERLARSDASQTREVAATARVELGKRRPAAVLSAAGRGARSADPSVRRAASEGLRGVVKTAPDGVRIVLDLLFADPDLQVLSFAESYAQDAEREALDAELRRDLHS